MTDICLVFTTCGSDPTARAMARDLVDHGLAVSVSLQPARTFFRLDGQTTEEEEVQLLAVTTVDRYPEVEARMLDLHTYEVPQVFMLRADACPQGASEWIQASLRSASRRSSASGL